MSRLPTNFHRRSFLTLGVAAAATAALADPPSTDMRQQDLRRFIRMRGALDDRLVIGFLSGRYNGLVDGVLTPLFGVYSATFSRYRPKGDGYEVVSFEQAYFTDLLTRQVLDRWKNPYTGDMVEPPVTSLPPAKFFIGPDLRLRSDRAPTPGVRLDLATWGPEIIGDEIVFVEQVYASRAAEGGAPPFAYDENTTLRAQLADVDHGDLGRVPCQTSFDAVVSWRPWLKMGNRPGSMTAFGYGRYGASIESLPRPWLEATARLRPELLTHPEAAMEALWRA
jgi:hypothetical protein